MSRSLFVVAAVSGMASDEIRETGTEGNMGVIRCPYTEGYESYSKYFCKGFYRTCETLIKSNGKDVWTYKGRISLHDNTEKKMFVVTITDLSMEDTGEYGCGIEKAGQDPFTLVHLTVTRAPKPPKPIQSTASATTISTNKALGNSISAVTNGTGSTTEDRGNSTQPAGHQSTLDTLITAGGALGGVLVALAIISGMFLAIRGKAAKEGAALFYLCLSFRSAIISTELFQDVRMYEEIQLTNSAQALDLSGTTSASDQGSTSACITVYSTVSNQGHGVHSQNTGGAQLTHCTVSPVMELNSQAPQSSNEPKYCEVYFTNDKAMDPTYSLLTAPKASTKMLHSAMSTAVKVKAPRGGNASIPCPYHRGSELYPKYFSKGRDRTELVRVTRHSTSSVKGRYSLEDDRETRELTVTIRNISVEDAGQYWCGVDIWGSDELTEVNLDVVEDILPSIDNSDTQKPPTQTGSATYETPTSSSGQRNISTSITGERMVLGGCLAGALLLCGMLSGMFIKVHLLPPATVDKQSMTHFITPATPTTSVIILAKFQTSLHNVFINTSLSLSAVHGTMSAAVRAKAPRGGNASIPCPYHRGSELYPKYFSKGRDRTELVRVTRHSTSSVKGRYSLEDDREKRELTVTIRNVSVEDAGLYWCGVDIWGSDELTEVNLDVVEDILPSTDNSDTQNASLINTISPPSESTGTGHHMSTQDRGISFTDLSVHLGGSLAAVVLLCGIMSAVFFLIKRNNAQRAAAPAPQEISTRSNKDSFIYEEIFPTNHRPDSLQYDAPAPNQTPLSQQPRSVLRPSSSRGQAEQPESVVYHLISLPKDPPDGASPDASVETASLYYASVNFVQSSN
ncbi:hypothetical protein NFI96_022293, partial [Prochilodus magdalenae]